MIFRYSHIDIPNMMGKVIIHSMVPVTTKQYWILYHQTDCHPRKSRASKKLATQQIQEKNISESRL